MAKGNITLKVGTVNLAEGEEFGVDGIDMVLLTRNFIDRSYAEAWIKALDPQFEPVEDDWYFTQPVIDARQSGSTGSTTVLAIWMEEQCQIPANSMH